MHSLYCYTMEHSINSFMVIYIMMVYTHVYYLMPMGVLDAESRHSSARRRRGRGGSGGRGYRGGGISGLLTDPLFV